MEQPAVSEEANNTTSNVAEHDESEATGEETEGLLNASEDSHLELNSKREHEASVAGSEKDASQNSHVKENAETEATRKESEPLLKNSHSERNSERQHDSKGSETEKEDAETEVGERRQDLLPLLNKTLALIMSYPMNCKDSKEVFDQHAIKIVRENPVNIQLERMGTMAKLAAGTAAVAITFLTFGFAAVLVLAGAAIGLTGVRIGLSSKELFEEPSKWQEVKPAFLNLIELLKNIAQAIAITCTAHETLENIRNDSTIVDESTLKDTHDNIQEIIHKHERIHYLKQTDMIKQFREIQEDTKQLLNIIKISFSFTSFKLEEKVNIAMESPFNTFGDDALTRLDNYNDVQETSSFVNFIRMFFIGDKKGNLHTTSFLKNTARANENITKTITGIAAAGIVLKAAKVETDVKFLGTDLEKLLGQKGHHTVALTDTANLMERMNAVFAKLNK